MRRALDSRWVVCPGIPLELGGRRVLEEGIRVHAELLELEVGEVVDLLAILDEVVVDAEVDEVRRIHRERPHRLQALDVVGLQIERLEVRQVRLDEREDLLDERPVLEVDLDVALVKQRVGSKRRERQQLRIAIEALHKDGSEHRLRSREQNGKPRRHAAKACFPYPLFFREFVDDKDAERVTLHLPTAQLEQRRGVLRRAHVQLEADTVKVVLEEAKRANKM